MKQLKNIKKPGSHLSCDSYMKHACKASVLAPSLKIFGRDD